MSTAIRGEPAARLSRQFGCPTMPDVTLDAVWDVVKWVLLVLVAGFIGQFGKSFALRLIERRRRKAADLDPNVSQPASDPRGEIEKVRLDAQAKIEKKRAKAKVKRAKKSDES